MQKDINMNNSASHHTSDDFGKIDFSKNENIVNIYDYIIDETGIEPPEEY